MSLSFKHRISVVSMLLAPILIVSLGGALGAVPARADDVTSRAEADAKVRDAQTPIEKINALSKRAHLPDKMEAPKISDWKSAAEDINEALQLVAELEKDGKTKVSQQANLYFWSAYVRAQLADYPAAIADYDRAEKAGYEADFAATESKGSELWNNRGQAKSHLRDYRGAIADFDMALAKQDDWLWRKNRANARFEIGDYDGAMADWTLALQAHPAIGKAPFDPALAPFNKAVVEHPESAAPLIARAKFLVQQAKAKAARDKGFADTIFFVAYEPMADDDDDDDDEVDNGLSAPELLKAALDDLDRAVKVEPNSAAAWLERGRTRALAMTWDFKQNGLHFEDANVLEDFAHATSADAKNAAAWYELGKLRLKIVKADDLPTVGQSEEEWNSEKRQKLNVAIANFSRVIILSPEASGWVHYLRAYAERLKPAPDSYSVLVDYGAAIAQKFKTLPDDPEAAVPDSKMVAEAHQVRGLILKDRGQWKAAVAEFDAAIVLNVNDLQSYFERGKIRLQRGEYDDSIADFSAVTKARPDYAEAWLLRAGDYDAKGEIDKAKADLETAFKLDATLRERVSGSRYDAQNPQAETGLAPAPIKDDPRVLEGTALDHKNSGNDLRIKGDNDGALAEYNAALLLDPKFADAYSNRAGVYAGRGEYDLALADYQMALQLDPKHCAAYLNRAFTWRDLGEHDQERADLDHAIEYAENDERRASAYGERATTRQHADDHDGALQDAQQATKLAPTDTALWSELGDLQLNGGDAAASIISYRHALQLKPDLMAPRVNLALALAQHSDASAAAELDRALAAATPAQIANIGDAIERGLQKSPDSATLKILQQHAAQAAKP